jgi:hypothetical protein
MAKRKGIDARAYQWFKRDKKEAFLRGLIAPVLEGECRACSLDNDDDRELTIAAVVAALLGDP